LLLIACEDPVYNMKVPLPEGVISCDAVSYEGRSERIYIACRRVDGRVSLIWTQLDRDNPYGRWTVDSPWGDDIEEITDIDCCSMTGVCAITTKHFANADTPGAIYAYWVDNPPAPWYEVTGTDFTGWSALAAGQMSSGMPGYSSGWVFATENGDIYAAAPLGDRFIPDWYVRQAAPPGCPPSYTIAGVASSMDSADPRWMTTYDTCITRSDDPFPESWTRSTTMPPGPMHTRNVLFDPATDRWLAVTDTLYYSGDNGITWDAVPRSRFQGLTDPYLEWLVGDGTNLWAMGESASWVWYSRNGGRSFERHKMWIPEGLVVSGATFVHNARLGVDFAIVIATDYREDVLHIAATWDPQE